MKNLRPLLSGSLPRGARSVSKSVSNTLKTSMPSSRSGASSKSVTLKGVKIPKASSSKGGFKLSSKTLSGKAVKAPKSSLKASSLSAALKSIISKAKKLPGAGMGQSSSIGAPASVPSPAFFGTPNAGPGKIGLDM